jgi:succinoglycan biosynthesis transport protein ExoP
VGGVLHGRTFELPRAGPRSPPGDTLATLMERLQQLRIFWAYKWLLLLFALAAAATAYFLSSRQTDTYKAESLGQIVSSRQAAGELLSEDELLSLSNVYLRLADTDTVLRLAHDDPAVRGNTEEFDESVSVEPQERVGILAFSAEDSDPQTAAAWANAYASAFAVYVDRLQTQQRERALNRIQQRIDEVSAEIASRGVAPDNPSVAGLSAEIEALQERAADETAVPSDNVRVIERAFPPGDPVSPRPTRDALLALIAALVLGAALVYLRETLVDRFSSPEEAAGDLGLPILGEIPRASGQTPVLEAFRRLRTAVVVALERQAAVGGSGPEGDLGHRGGILVTGAEPGSGKSFITANLARALAAEGWRVVAIDGDLRRPTLHDHFELPRRPGLGDLLVDEGLDRHVQTLTSPVGADAGDLAGGGEMRVVTAGRYIEDSVERLSSRRMAMIMTRLQEESDFVVFDSPPALAVVDPVVLARYSDGVIFVIDSRKTRRRDARRAVQTMRAIGTPVLGLVVNRSHAPVGGYYSYEATAELQASDRMKGVAG